jgi:tRNA(Ile)-lysidine synthase
MSFLKKFQDNIREKDLFSLKDILLLAVSGGVDSVVLCELCKQAGYNFIIAHCNFQLRGEESERDERFVKELGVKYAVEVWFQRFDTEKYADESKLATQEAARKLRYDWFKRLINARLNDTVGQESTNKPINYLLTAHHADDNVETLLMNFFRGTGLHGLTGIPEKTGYIRRPLLNFSKDELVAFAKENKLDWVEDSSNLSSKYTRNFLRNEIIPAISKVYPQVKENLLDDINRFKEIENLYKVTVENFVKKLCRKKGNEVHIPIKQLMGYNNRSLIYEIISEYGFSEKQVDEVIKLSASESGRYIQSPNNENNIIRHRHWFIISPVVSTISENIVIEKEDKKVHFAEGRLQVDETSNQQPATSNNIATVDATEIYFPLLLRRWKEGDYFYPLGMKKKKKLARFFIDQKLSRSEKAKVWVIESNQRIIWVVGQRIDERFKLTEKTKNLLRFELTPSE